MKRLISVAVCSLLIVAAGCDLFGVEQTRGYITGEIYQDMAKTIPAEGVFVFLEGDTATVYSQSVTTNADGEFMMEVQMYPDMVEGEGGGVGYQMPDEISVGFYAVRTDTTPPLAYIYCTKQSNPMTLGMGDTIYVWPICYEDFTSAPPGGGGGGGS